MFYACFRYRSRRQRSPKCPPGRNVSFPFVSLRQFVCIILSQNSIHIPVPPCLYKGCGGRPCPVTESRHQDPRRLAHRGSVARAVVRSQGPGAPAPKPVGVSGQLGKEQALPRAENLFSRYGVRLSEYDGASHQRAHPVRAELPEFLQRQVSCTTETLSKAPGAYGIHSRSHAAQIASYEPTSVLVTLPSPEMGMEPWYTSRDHHADVSPHIQPQCRPCLSTARSALRTSVPLS